MPILRVLGTGRIDERDSAYPQAIQLPGGEILCSFSGGGGPAVHGGTEWAFSRDGGATWQVGGVILPPSEQPRCTNSLRLSLSADGAKIYAYGARFFREIGQKLGEGRRDAVLCTSRDAGRSWSSPTAVPMPVDCPLEVSHGVLPLSSGRLLAPAATLPSRDRLGEQVFIAISDDEGEHWQNHSIAFQDPAKRHGFFEHKLAQIDDGRVLATAWTVTLGDVLDRPNSFSLSHDDGRTWGPVRSTAIHGQTLAPIPLEGNRLLVLYNRRYGEQGIVMALVTFSDEEWRVHYEGLLYDAKAVQSRSGAGVVGLDALDSFQFGLPSAIRLQDGTFLATHWSRENDRFGIRWTKLSVEW